MAKKWYKVTVTETYAKDVLVYAETAVDAEQRAHDAHNNTEFILKPEDTYISSEYIVTGEDDGSNIDNLFIVESEGE